ncbi:hypothetical protein [Sphingomonas hankookensis]
MADTAQLVNTLVGLALMGVLALVYWLSIEESHKRLDDHEDDRTLWLDQLPEKIALAPAGTYRVTVLRQSGNVHAERVVTGSAQDALKVALATFRRAKIDAVHVGRNTRQELSFGRMYHDHRGKAEGKKVGRAVIVVLEEAATASPHVMPQPDRAAPSAGPSVQVRVEVSCDCGHLTPVPESDLAEPHVCSACGRTNRHTLAEVMRVKAELARLRQETRDRLDTGMTPEQVVADLERDDPAGR